MLRQAGATELEPVFRIAASELGTRRSPANARQRAAVPAEDERRALFRWFLVRFGEETDIQATLGALRAEPEVEAAEFNLLWRLADVPNPPDAGTDTDLSQQWHLDAIHAPDAWEFLRTNVIHPGGLRHVVVAVIDSGVDYQHEDLAGNIWINGGEIPGNEIDDDGNGFVDDVHGCSVVSDNRSHSGDPIDLNGHGTHVAGIIAATAYNGLGGVGLAFNTQIMAVRAVQYSGTLAIDDIAEGILYAADNGAQVINMSFGGSHRSQVVEDALAVALSRAVLVAAAGNSGAATEKAPNVPEDPPDGPFYPAALPWVIGVMATDRDDWYAPWSNYDSWVPTRIEYETAAPGVDIFSTIPGNRYAAWSGTSMATPIVSGVAALVRSYFNDPSVYSSRFVMGQVVGSATNMFPPLIDAYLALSGAPTPNVWVLEDWLFDLPTVAAHNDDDGRIDAGETIHIALELFNHWGFASNLVVTLDPTVGVVGPDPYVTMITDTVNYGAIGPWNTADNGFTYDEEGVIVAVDRPFAFQVATNCPNDHIINFQVIVRYQNGLKPEDPTSYTNAYWSLTYPVMRGRDLPQVISEDMDLTSAEYWLVPGPVLIEEGATVTVGPGTQIQWGGVSEDPYHPGPQKGSILVRGTLLMEGTAEQPVSLFPSYLVNGQTTVITAADGGSCKLGYTRIRNPELRGLTLLDHCYVDWDAYTSVIQAQQASFTIFHKLMRDPILERWPYGPLQIGTYNGCLFDISWQGPGTGARIEDTVFLQDNEERHPLRLVPPVGFEKNDLDFYHVQEHGSAALALLDMRWPCLEAAEVIAQYFGGHVMSIPDATFDNGLLPYIDTAPQRGQLDFLLVGLTSGDVPGTYRWIDGTPFAYSRWATGYPIEPPLVPQWYDRNKTIGGGLTAAFYRGYFGWIGDFPPVSNDGGWFNLPAGWSINNGASGYFYTFSFLLRLPSGLTEALLDAGLTNSELQGILKEMPGDLAHNAFLSPYWDPNLGHWMRIYGEANAHTAYSSVVDNYWGTTSTTLINHAIWDYNDDFTSARVLYGTPPPHGFASTYPFVERVLINGAAAETVPLLGGGTATFTVIFNRDMDISVQPFVTFGPETPFTDFIVGALGDGWVDARTWKGTFEMNPMTGDGYHLMRISGAVAADDPWLVSGYDVGRFRFEVKTMGVAAMTLQATGGEGRIQLGWQQDDFSLLAGYNIYRAKAADGDFERINPTIIPVGQEHYTDEGVPPAVPKFYKFTVVQTDLEESDFSNVASASAVDTVPPAIQHAPITSAPPARGLRVSAMISDNIRVTSAMLFYRLADSGVPYVAVALLRTQGDEWSATIPASAVRGPGLDYYLVASDGISDGFSGTAATPHRVVVIDQPTLASVSPNRGPAEGGTAVSLSGIQFQSGLSVFFDNVLASDVEFISENQVLCVTPPHFPATVDVKVVNPDATESVLLQGFHYETTGTVVSIPQLNADYGAEIEAAISIANATGLRAATITVEFDRTVLAVKETRLGSLTAGWNVTANAGEPGRLHLALAHSSSVTGSGTLAIVTFSVTGPPPASTSLAFTEVLLNDGAIGVSSMNGLFSVNAFWSLAGTVSYFGGGPLPGAALSLVGVGTHAEVSDSEGTYLFSDLPTGDYTLTPSKQDGAGAISAMDASLILQAEAGLMALSPAQQLAADVNRNGSITSMDASYVLEHSVGLRALPFPGAGRIWDFMPAQRMYAPLSSNPTAQNFTGVLVGEVTGNWTPGSAPGNGSAAPLRGPTPQPMGNGSCLLAVDWGGILTSGRTNRILISSSEPLFGLDLVLGLEPASARLEQVEVGGIAEGTLLASNNEQPGQARIGLAAAHAISGRGVLLTVTSDSATPLRVHVVKAEANEGALDITIENSIVSFDSDGDGLVDSDETTVFGTNPRVADTDGDGLSDGSEVMVATNPTDPASCLKLAEIVEAGSGQCLVSWKSVPGLNYVLERAQTLGSLDWTPAGDPAPGTGAMMSTLVPVEATARARFYRLRVTR